MTVWVFVVVSEGGREGVRAKGRVEKGQASGCGWGGVDVGVWVWGCGCI